MKRYPLAHKIIIPPSLLPLRTDGADIRKTFAAARKQLKATAEVRVMLPALQVEDPVVERMPWGSGPGEDLGRFNCQGAYVFPLKRKL